MAKGIKDFTKVLGLVRDIVMEGRQDRPDGYSTNQTYMAACLLGRGWRVPTAVVRQSLEALENEGWLSGRFAIGGPDRRYFYSRTDEERAAWLAQEERAKKAARRLKALGITAEVDGGEEEGGKVEMTVAALEWLLDAAEKGKEVVK